MNDTRAEEEHIIDLTYDILTLLSFIPFGTTYVLAFSYLNSVSLAKECLHVYLYKDVLLSMLLWRKFSATEVVIDFLNGGETGKIQVIIIAFGLWFAALYLALTKLCKENFVRWEEMLLGSIYTNSIILIQSIRQSIGLARMRNRQSSGFVVVASCV